MSAKNARSDAEHRHLIAQSSGDGNPEFQPAATCCHDSMAHRGQFYEQFLVHVRVQMTSPLLVQLTATSA